MTRCQTQAHSLRLSIDSELEMVSNNLIKDIASWITEVFLPR